MFLKKIFLASVILFATVMVIGCATLATRQPEIQGIHPRITGLDFLGITMTFDVDVYNPNSIAIHNPRLRYGMDIEGRRFFYSETTSLIDLPASSLSTVSFPVRLSYLDLWQTYQTLRHAPEANYNLNGAFIFPVRGRSLELPFLHNGTFPILQPLSFSDIKLHFSDVSLAQAKINIDGAVKNPNVFPLGIQDLGYVLQLGNVKLGDLVATTSDTLDAGQTGRMSLSGEVSLGSAVVNMIKGGSLDGANILPSGSLQTPYGPVTLQRQN